MSNLSHVLQIIQCVATVAATRDRSGENTYLRDTLAQERQRADALQAQVRTLEAEVASLKVQVAGLEARPKLRRRRS